MPEKYMLLRPSKNPNKHLRITKSPKNISTSKLIVQQDHSQDQKNIYTTYTSKNIQINQRNNSPFASTRSNKQNNNRQTMNQQLKKKLIRQKIRNKQVSRSSTHQNSNFTKSISINAELNRISPKGNSQQREAKTSIEQRTMIKLIRKVNELEKQNKQYKQQLTKMKAKEYFQIDKQKIIKILTQLEQYKQKYRSLKQMHYRQINCSEKYYKGEF